MKIANREKVWYDAGERFQDLWKGRTTMKKLGRSLPLLILILVLAFFLYPAESSPASPAAAPAAEAVDTLNLVSSVSPSAAPASSGKESGQPSQGSDPTAVSAKDEEELLPEDGSYTTKEDVALYLHQYGHLPSNFITKKEAKAAGWPGGSLEAYFPGMCIGGDYFGNYEGKLPKAKGRSWTECDINTLGKRSRGAERIIFSNDGLIYYTDDHYESYTQLY